ncbi:MAG: DUF5053 domain-containing protein [Bacteroides sp.]|nr:DUF5053 domain-containing protein [Bacteroides sp.]MCM1390378.1 DUF5053 domain-containing protein [Bacteroides sp.]
MYLGRKEIYDKEKYESLRAESITDKGGATEVAFSELEGLVNKTQLATQYFKRTHAWLSQKLHGCTVLNRQKAFTEAEYHQLAEAFRDIAKRLIAHADEIDAAAMDD